MSWVSAIVDVLRPESRGQAIVRAREAGSVILLISGVVPAGLVSVSCATRPASHVARAQQSEPAPRASAAAKPLVCNVGVPDDAKIVKWAELEAEPGRYVGKSIRLVGLASLEFEMEWLGDSAKPKHALRLDLSEMTGKVGDLGLCEQSPVYVSGHLECGDRRDGGRPALVFVVKGIRSLPGAVVRELWP